MRISLTLFITLFASSICLAADTDEDFVSDENDNCPNVYNPYQLDRDSDGVGNACDPEALEEGVVATHQMLSLATEEVFIYELRVEAPSDMIISVKGYRLEKNYPDFDYELRDEDGTVLVGNKIKSFLEDVVEDSRTVGIPTAGSYFLFAKSDYQTEMDVSYTLSEFSATLEEEPNDNLETATHISISSERFGYFWPQDGDVDHYVINSVSDTEIEVSVAAGDVFSRAAIELLDDTGQVIEEINQGFPDNGKKTILVGAESSVYVRLSSSTFDDQYNIAVVLADDDADGIPNDSDNCKAVANLDQIDTDNDGAGDSCDEDDDNDGYLDVTDIFPLDSNEWEDFDKDGEGDNSDIDDDNDGASDEDELAFGSDPKDDGSYPVRLETEANDELETADELIPSTPVVGSLSEAEDVDVFSFETTGEVDLTLDIRKLESDFDYILYALVDASEVVYAAGTVYNDNGVVKRIGVATAGTYFIVVGGSDAYDISDGEYEVRVDLSEFTNSIESEPNNTEDQGDVLQPNEAKIGHLGGNPDVDFYRMKIEENSSLEVSVRKLASDFDYINYSVKDSDGNLLAAGDVYNDNQESKRIGIEEGGTYYLIVDGEGYEEPSYNEYEIIADFLPPQDEDGDGVPLAQDNCMAVANPDQVDTDGDGEGDSCDSDDDGDGYSDLEDQFPKDGTEWLDDDSDGVGNNADAFPNDATETEDSDSDGVGDSADAFPLDASESVDTDADGVGDNADTDDDGDGVADTDDAFPLISVGDLQDTDSDGYPDDCDSVCLDSGMLADADDDNDGVEDVTDAFPTDASESKDQDLDGVGDNADAFPQDASETLDTDGDGVGDNADAFDLDASESVDTDGDGIGNNADLDDDGDGFTDEEELADGTNPLSRFSCRSGCFSFDIDENSEAKALTDGLLVIRHLFGFTGDALATGAISAGATRNRAEDISTLLADADSELDIDGNGESKALSDGLLLIRYLFGFTGDALTVGAIGEGATRDTSEAIEAYISDRVPASE